MNALPQTMQVAAIEDRQLVTQTRPVPAPGRGEVLIAVAAAGVNRPDVLQRLGFYPPPPGASDLPGLEVAGQIVAIGPDADPWQVGAPVTALLAGGGYAQFALAPAPQCLPIPAGLSALEAASLPECAFTVWANMVELGGLTAGASALVHGGSSGIGTMAIQLGRALGATVHVTAGSDEKCRACLDLGAASAINYRDQDFAAAIAAATEGRGVDLVLDMVGGDYVPRNLDCLSEGGRHVSIAFQRGAMAEISIMQVMRRRLHLTGSTLRARPVSEKGRLAREVAREVWPLLADGRIRPLIHASFPLDKAAEAHAMMESSAHIGKIMLTPPPH